MRTVLAAGRHAWGDHSFHPDWSIDVPNGEPLRAEQSWLLERAGPTPFYLDQAPTDATHSVNDGGLTTTAPTTSSAVPRPEEFVMHHLAGGLPPPAQMVARGWFNLRGAGRAPECARARRQR